MGKIAEMNIRAKYATESADGHNLDVMHKDVSDLKETVGDADSGLVKDVADLQSGKQDKLTTTNVGDGTIDKVIGFDNGGTVVKGTIEGGTKWTVVTSTMTNNERVAVLSSATYPYVLYTEDSGASSYIYVSYNGTARVFGSITTKFNSNINTLTLKVINTSTGAVTTKTYEFVTTVDSSSTNAQIPFALAVKNYADNKAGTKLYKHTVQFTDYSYVTLIVINNDPNSITITWDATDGWMIGSVKLLDYLFGNSVEIMAKSSGGYSSVGRIDVDSAGTATMYTYYVDSSGLNPSTRLIILSNQTTTVCTDTVTAI